MTRGADRRNERHRHSSTVATRAAAPISVRVRGLSDRSIAWLFILPTMALLLAINIFPLIWAIRLSFTGFMANLPTPARFIGVDNYVDILTDEDIWANFRITAHFVFWTIALQDSDRPGSGIAHQPKVPRP